MCAISSIDDRCIDFIGQKLWGPWMRMTHHNHIHLHRKMLLTVSVSVSPFFTEELPAVKLITSALKRFSASSNDSLVRVEFSKKRFATVKSLSEGTFLMGRLMTSLNSCCCLKNQFQVIFRQSTDSG